ncbi:Lipase 2 precursor [Corynebacterium faecale]|uniref:SGNH/GDSL hydrolase family protein n=1 Tax=Corynebacterium faecale TaxID=1758466 RepID=UPI0025B417F5|nr:SGNH/GDSL hydrolase family protein [Corynebacterium faecale]WJY92159.1 Lipase 2 precursor [Corynebacterium faecale]
MAMRKLAAVMAATIASAAMLTTALVPTATAQSSGSSGVDVSRALTSSAGEADSRAPEGGAKVVVFGDSHTSGTTMPWRTDERGCLKGAGSWPEQLQANLGLPRGELIDVSCSGASINSDGFHFSDEVRHAEARGAIGARTEHIFVQLGKNDTWGSGVNLLESVQTCLFDLGAGCGDRAIASGKMQNPEAVTAEHYAERVKPVIDYLKYYAPNAEITLVGYQEYTPRGGSQVCVRLGGTPLVKNDAPALVDFMNRLDMSIAGAADILGVSHVDLRSATEGHSSCSNDPWVVGVLDARTDMLAGPWHPSHKGDAVTAGILRDRVNA